MGGPARRIKVSQHGRWSWSADVDVLTSLFGQPGEPAWFMTYRTFRATTRARVLKKAERYARSLDPEEITL